MPTSSIIHAACFALGAAVGGGTVLAINASKKREALAQVSSPKVPNLPIVEVGVSGVPHLSAGAATAVGPVLKYGNPGTHTAAAFRFPALFADNNVQALFSTNLCAERMWLDTIVACGILHGSVQPPCSPPFAFQVLFFLPFFC
jgi:hypothetical protein